MEEYLLYIVMARDPDGTVSEYEHGNIRHASEHFNQEAHAELYGYRDGLYTLLEVK